MLIIVIIVAVILILLLILKTNTVRQRITVLVLPVISVLSFCVFVVMLFSVQRTLLIALLGIFYLSTLAFFILWTHKRLQESKKVYFVLCVPLLCIAAVIGVLKYQHYIDTILTVNEYDIEHDYRMYQYEPFREYNQLAKLNGESRFKITDNLPVLDGATALCPVYAAFAQAVYPEPSGLPAGDADDKPDGDFQVHPEFRAVVDEYNFYHGPVLCSTTEKAYKNLLNGSADIIFCAKPSNEQREQFEEQRLKLKLVPIGKEAFVFFVNKNNPVDDITVQGIQGIYSGMYKNWRTLKGRDQKIRAYQRPPNSGSQTALEHIMGEIQIEKPRRENVTQGMGEIVNNVASYRNFSNAIGYSFLHFATRMVKNDNIKLLSINGTSPTKETIRSGVYPFSDNFYAIYVDREDKNPNIEPFIQWILGEQGQELVEKTGYVKQ